MPSVRIIGGKGVRLTRHSQETCAGRTPSFAPNWLVSLGTVMLVALAIGAALSLAFALPGASHQLQAVFWDGGNLLNQFCFGLFVIGLGAGSGLLGHALRWIPLPWVFLPFLALALCIVAYLCLYLSVTPETLHDILGYPLSIQPGRANELPALFAPLRPLAERSPALAAGLESAIRFAALYAPLPVLTALVIAIFGDFATLSAGGLRHVPSALVAIVLLWLCKVVVIDFPATSNVVELVNPHTPGGVSGLYFANLATMTIAVSAVAIWLTLLGIMPIWIALALLVTASAASTGLMALAVESAVGKFGLSFHALDFLITGARDRSLSEELRIAIWGGMHWGLSLVIALGVRAVLPRGRLQQRGPRRSGQVMSSRSHRPRHGP